MSGSGPGAGASDRAGARHVFAVGVATYQDPSWAPLPQVRPDVAAVIRSLAALGYAPACTAPTGLIDPEESRDVEKPLLEWLRGHFGFGDDTLVIYHAGHGVAEHDHYLVCSATEFDTAALKVTALPTARLVELAGDAGVQRLLVIVDACYAGDGAADVLAQTAKSHLVAAAAARGDQRRHWKSLAVLCAARSGEEADDGAFARTLSAVLASATGQDRLLAGERPEFIHLSDVVREINRELAGQGLPQRADLAVIHDDGTGFLPNPRHVAGLSDDLDLAEQRVASEQHRLRQRELAEHFGPRGAGAHGPEETGHYFTGRTAVLTRLARWLRGESERDVRLFQVTGGPGTGKSSVLGRLVTRSDPTARHTIPDETVVVSTDVPPGTIDLAVHAAGKRLPDVLSALGDALGVPAGGPTDVVTGLKSLGRSFTLVIDALDEASTNVRAYEAESIAAFLQQATAQAPRFRVLLGARPEVLPDDDAQDTVARVDLDDPRWISRWDIVDYAARLLSAPHGPGSSSGLPGEPVERAAWEIGRVTFPNYLVTRIIARALADPGRTFWAADPAEWASLLPAPVGEQGPTQRHRRAYRGIGPAFLWARNVQLSPERIPLYRAVLTALAYRQGAGLPLAGVWTAVAGALYGEPVSEKQITEILATDAAAAYVTETMDGHGRSVYRLYHQALVDNLRSGHENGVTEYLAAQPGYWGVVHSRQVRRIIASGVYEALAGSVCRTSQGARDWHDADPYLLDHLMAHAAAAGRADELLVDAGFLVHARADAVAPFLQRAGSPDAVRAARVYRASLGRHRDADPDTRRFLLALDATRLEDHELADRLRRPTPSPLPWPVWNTASPRPGLLRSIDAGARALTVLPGLPLAAVADAEGMVRCWNLDDGQPLVELAPCESGAVTALAATLHQERVVLITGHGNGDVRVWDLSDDVPRSKLLLGDPPATSGPVASVGCAVAEGRVVALGTAADGVTRIWDTRTREQVAVLPAGADGGPPTVVHPYGSPTAATARDGGGFALWHLPGGEPVELDDDCSAAPGPVTALAEATFGARAAVITGNARGELHRWFVSSSRFVSAGLPGSTARRGAVPGDPVLAVATVPLDDTVIAVTGHQSGHVALWDLDGGRPLVLPGHHAPVHTVATAELDTGLAAVTADDTGSVSLWDLQDVSAALPGELGVRALTCVRLDRRTVTVTGHRDGHLRLWDTAGGLCLSRHAAPTAEPGGVTALGCVRLGERTLAATAYAGNLLRFWDLADPADRGCLVPVDAAVAALDCTRADHLAVAVTGHADGSVRLWDLAARTGLGTLLPPGGSPVTSVACGHHGPARAISGHLDGSCRSWDLERRVQLSEWAPAVSAPVEAVAMSLGEDGVIAVVGHSDGGVVLRDAAGGRLLGAAMRGEGAALASLTCTERDDQSLVLAGHRDGTLDLFDLATRTHLRSVPLLVGIDALAWAEEGLLAVAAGAELYVLDGI
ncbi:WD40 repeat domain-containing protein [Streptomyces sp. NPDC052682]|uniref:WD40 repeat domain-containing protein n=1 Tax=Streptomyces sp. NPDC052682 TaxID=3154954 RepID=UPI00342FB550